MKRCIDVKLKAYDKFSDTNYSFFTDLDVKNGDLVVCDTMLGMAVGKVVGLRGNSSKANKWIVSIIDQQAFDVRVKRQAEADELYEAIQLRIEQLAEMKLIEDYAKNDEALRLLVDRYKNMSGYDKH